MATATNRMSHEERRERRRRIAERVRGGESPAAVARDLGLSLQTVYSACSEHGVVPFPGCRTPSPSTFRVLARLWDATLTHEEIAAEFGITKQRVHQIYQLATNAGIPVPPRIRGRAEYREAVLRAASEGR